MSWQRQLSASIMHLSCPKSKQYVGSFELQQTAILSLLKSRKLTNCVWLYNWGFENKISSGCDWSWVGSRWKSWGLFTWCTRYRVISPASRSTSLSYPPAPAFLMPLSFATLKPSVPLKSSTPEKLIHLKCINIIEERNGNQPLYPPFCCRYCWPQEPPVHIHCFHRVLCRATWSPTEETANTCWNIHFFKYLYFCIVLKKF